jgi:transposase
VLTLGPTTRVYLARGTTDLRKGFDGLAGAVRELLAQDPSSGHLFVFCGRRRHMIKVLYWDGTGFWVLAKRLARGTFAWPTADDDRCALELRPDELSALLGGVDLRKTTWRPWWRQHGASLQTPRPPIPELPLVS